MTNAITSSRPYRLARTPQEALRILEAEAGERLDPAGVSAFFDYYTERLPRPLWNARPKALDPAKAELAL